MSRHGRRLASLCQLCDLGVLCGLSETMRADLIRDASRALALINVDRPEGGSFGTAFLVGGRHLLTCRHLVAGASSIRATLVVGGEAEAALVRTHDEADLALLELSRDPGAAGLPVGPAKPVPLGTEAFFLGFPHADLFRPPLAVARRAMVGNRYDVLGAEYYVLDAMAVEGESGAPVLFADRVVVLGVLSARLDPESTRARLRGAPEPEVSRAFPDRTALSFAVIARHAVDLLEQAGVRFQRA